MSVHRYRAIGPDVDRLKRIVESGLSTTDSLACFSVDVTLVDDNNKDDLDAEMLRMGFTFIESNPSDSPSLCLDSPNGDTWNIQIDNNGDLSVDNGLGSSGEIVQITDVAPLDVDAAAAAVGTSHDAARADHKHDIATAAAIELTDSTSAEGTANSIARSDHTHAHGNRGGGALHALVTTSVDGFMSATDKDRLDKMWPFGSGHLYSESLVQDQTTGVAFEQKVTITTGVIPAGDYLIFVSYNWDYSHNNSMFRARVQVDDNTILIEHDEDPHGSGGNFGSNKLGFSSFARTTLTNASHTIDLDFASSSTGKTAKIFNARLMIWRAS